MNADERRFRLDQITEKVIGCAQRVSNALGCGFLEKVDENALAHEIRKAGLAVVQQHPVRVLCDGKVVGEYTSDWLVEESVIVELKTVSSLSDVHKAQCLNYLKATGPNACLLMNFARPRVEINRIVLGF